MAVIGKFVVTIFLLAGGTSLIVLIDSWNGLNLSSFSKIQIGIHTMMWMSWGSVLSGSIKKLWRVGDSLTTD